MTIRHDEDPLRLIAPMLKRAYALDATNLDAVARLLGSTAWAELVRPVVFEEVDTGGGCAMWVGEIPELGHTLGLTDGEAGLPQSPEAFWLGVVTTPEEHEVYGLTVQGEVQWRSGAFVDEGRVPGMRPQVH